MKNSGFFYGLVYSGLFYFIAGCSTTYEHIKARPKAKKEAILASNFSLGNGSETEYCVLKITGITASELQEGNYADARGVEAVHEKSISESDIHLLKSTDFKSPLEALKVDIEEVNRKSGFQGTDCNKIAGLTSNRLAITSDESFNFTRNLFLNYCMWGLACGMSAMTHNPASGQWFPPEFPRPPVIRQYGRPTRSYY